MVNAVNTVACLRVTSQISSVLCVLLQCQPP